MQIINKKIDELKKYENNARYNNKTIKKMEESIKQFGFINPIIIDENGIIIAGHTRYEASKNLGYNEVPCIIINDLDEDKKNLFRIVENKTSEYSNWDFELLDEELNDIKLDLTEFGFNGSMFEEKERKKCICPNCNGVFEI